MPQILAAIRWSMDPYIFRFESGFGIKYYGLAYALGFLLAGLLLYLYWRKGRSPFDVDGQSDLLLYAMLGVLIGGRLGYILFYEPEILQSPKDWLAVWKGGMASHGGFIGVIAGTWLAARKNGIEFLTAGDLIATLAPPGLLLGRLANFINGELWGKVTTVPWAIEFAIRDANNTIVEYTEPRHPSQLYEAALEGLLMLAYTQWRLWRTPVLKEQPGRLAGEFLLGYAIVRIIGEQFREPDEGIPTPLGLNRGAWLSLGLAAAGVFLIIRGWRNRRPSWERRKRR